MKEVLEVGFSGWTATPKMPFVLSGNSVCMTVPSYSIVLGIIGCCLGRVVSPEEVKIGFRYSYDTTGSDLETRHRLEFDGGKVKTHKKGTDVYLREFHSMPKLTVWLDRTDWEDRFHCPVGTPALGRSQDILTIESVRKLAVNPVSEAKLSGCLLPFSSDLKVGGQLIQMAEAFEENDEVGGGRSATRVGVFIAVQFDSQASVRLPNLYQTVEDSPSSLYMHELLISPPVAKTV